MYAVYHGHIDMVKFLLENGASVNVLNSKQQNAMMIAARRGKLPIVQELFKVRKFFLKF